MRIPAVPRGRTYLAGLLLTGAVLAAAAGGTAAASTAVPTKASAVKSSGPSGIYHVPIQTGGGQIIHPRGSAA
ncbi:hypothetical protein [Streptomyces sp. A012304]|uniref:hypothetical protein n=1 Tax=Streptomyces sp. A012304 TaxID=375446 RepID=UPI002230EB76|nr:hypothetical protein [Streptomyces sp. A012304]GKQ40871.1 hypothetical protein ALMP_73910 [Streptomyces sp. A012304]